MSVKNSLEVGLLVVLFVLGTLGLYFATTISLSSGLEFMIYLLQVVAMVLGAVCKTLYDKTIRK